MSARRLLPVLALGLLAFSASSLSAQSPAFKSVPARAPIPKESVPKFPDNTVFRPTYLTSDIAHYAGLAFRLRAPRTGDHFLVTAHSIFGPAAELAEQMNPQQIAKNIVGAVGVAINDPSTLVIARPYVGPIDAQVASDKGCSRDLAMFLVISGSNEPALTLDPALPIKGDYVWLVVKYVGTQKVGLEPAVIVWTSPSEIRYYLGNQQANLSGVPGAPIISSQGQVVGMHVGTFTGGKGTQFGFACPASAIQDAMDSILGAPEVAPKPEPKQDSKKSKKSLIQ